ncbi:MAG: hypothetical protein KKI08_13595, partial [Armatimonadetes bacterium]|nr:hypothetical protein [Armatimonadota bacterium]
DTAWHDLAISVKGKHIEVELDGKRLIAVDDNDLLGVGPVPSGGVCLSARKWSRAEGDTIVAFDDLRVE